MLLLLFLCSICLTLTTIFARGQNFCSRNDTIFCGVFDGHGPYGHLVAKRVRDLLPLMLGADLGMEDGRASTGNIKLNTHDLASPEHIGRGGTAISSEAQQNGEYPEVFPALRTLFLKAFHVMDRDLKLHKNIDCFFSGTTAVAVIKQVTETNDTIVLFFLRNIFFSFILVYKLFSISFCILQRRNLIIGNLGDSRAVLGTRDENNQLVAVQLTVDLKPNIPSKHVFSFFFLCYIASHFANLRAFHHSCDNL